MRIVRLLAPVAALTISGIALGAPTLAGRIAAHTPRPELAPSQAMGEEVSFSNGASALKGFIYKPEGNGPFPALIWNHGSEPQPGWQPELAAFYNRKGFVFFIPHRHGHGRSAGGYILDVNQWT